MDISVWADIVSTAHQSSVTSSMAIIVDLMSSSLYETFLTIIMTHPADGAAAPAEEAPKKKKKKKAIEAGEQAAANVARAVVEKTEGEKKKKKKKKATEA